MSFAIADSRFPCVPRMSGSIVKDIPDNSPQRSTVTYNCSQGHIFSLDFLNTAIIPPIWECEECETIAIRL